MGRKGLVSGVQYIQYNTIESFRHLFIQLRSSVRWIQIFRFWILLETTCFKQVTVQSFLGFSNFSFFFSQRFSRHIHLKIRAWFRYQTIHQVSTDCKWKKCKAFQNFNISCFITYDSCKLWLNTAWMIKVFLTADIAVGMAPLAVKFAYQSFKYMQILAS